MTAAATAAPGRTCSAPLLAELAEGAAFEVLEAAFLEETACET
jgi:hypothetical protein